MDYSVERTLNLLYIILDICFLTLLGYLLLKMKKKMAFLFGVAGALIYFIVDYGGFYLLLGTRVINGANPFWFELWLSSRSTTSTGILPMTSEKDPLIE